MTFSNNSSGSVTANNIVDVGYCPPGERCLRAHAIVITGNSNVSVTGNTINLSTGTGVFVSGSVVPLLRVNQIYNQSMGVYLYDSDAKRIEQNWIKNNTTGFYTRQYSYAEAGDPVLKGTSYGQGRNNIINNATSVRAHYFSDMMFGWTNFMDGGPHNGETHSARNHIYNESDFTGTNHYAYATSNSTIWAEGNYWGEECVDTDLITKDQSSAVNFVPWMKDPWDFWPPTGGLDGDGCDDGNGDNGNGDNGDDNGKWIDPESADMIALGTLIMSGSDDPNLIFALAQRKFKKREYNEARPLFKEVVVFPLAEDRLKNRSLAYLYWIFRRTEFPGILTFIKNFTAPSTAVDIVRREALYAMYAHAGEYTNSLNKALSAKNTYPDSDAEMHALIHLAFLSSYTESMKEISELYLDELLMKYGAELDGSLLAALGVHGDVSDMYLARGGGSGIKSEDVARDEEGTFDLTSYPNPFNPVTIIQFSLPEAGNVKLRVYDILGREIIRLVDEFREAGVHRVEFNAVNLPSGMYFTRIEFSGKSLVQRMMLVK